MVARTWESSDMVSDSRELNGEGGNVTKVIRSLAYKVCNLRILGTLSTDGP